MILAAIGCFWCVSLAAAPAAAQVGGPKELESQRVRPPKSRLHAQGGPEWAQLGDERPPGRPGRGAKQNPQHRRHLEQLRILKMLELLDLGEDQEVGFLQAFRGVRKEHRRLAEERGRLFEDLTTGLQKQTLDDRKLDELINGILRLEEEKQQVHKRFIEEARRILTVEQLARFIIFQERFEAELLENVKHFRARQEYRRAKGLLDQEG